MAGLVPAIHAAGQVKSMKGWHADIAKQTLLDWHHRVDHRNKSGDDELYKALISLGLFSAPLSIVIPANAGIHGRGRHGVSQEKHALAQHGFPRSRE